MKQMSEVNRKPGETLTAYFVRLDSLWSALKEEEPTHDDLFRKEVVRNFLKVLPPGIQAFIPEDVQQDPEEVLILALKLVQKNP